MVFAVAGLLAIAYIWVLRILWRRAGQEQPKLTAIGGRLLVAFVAVVGSAVVLRQFFPETTLGAWLRAEGTMTNVVIASLGVLFAIEAILKWLGIPTSEERVQRDV